MAQLPAYAVDGGMVPAAMARRATHALSSGANGVVGIDDLKVTALPTPGAGVQISRGSALAAMQTAGAHAMESYVISQDSTFNLDVPATGGSARTDYIIARVMDWHFTGEEPPADPTTALYWEFARVNTLNGITYPHVPLARLSIPANRSSIGNPQIIDMREVAIPRRDRFTEMRYVETRQDLTSQTYINWPSESLIGVDIPEWAGTAIVRCDVVETLLFGNGNTDGRMTLMLGNQPAYSGERRYDEVWGGSTSREDHTIVSMFHIPANFRGTTQVLRVRGRRLNGTGYLVADAYTQVIYDIEFLEKELWV